MASLSEALTLHRVTNVELGEVNDRLVAFEEAAGRRLAAGLALLNVERVAARLARGEETARDCRRVVLILRDIEGEHETVAGMYPLVAGLNLLLSLGDRIQEEELWVKEVLAATRRLHGEMLRCRESLLHTPCGIDHANENITVGRYLVAGLPQSDDPPAVFHAAVSMLDAYEML